jgi:hypothetical protein
MSWSFFKKAVLLGVSLLVPALMHAQGTDPVPPPPSTLTPNAPPPAACTFPETPGTWCTVAAPPAFPGTMLLLTNGGVMVEAYGTANFCGPAWMILTPAANGDYGSGTWATTASMATPRLYFGSEVMPNGKVWVLGGEYSGSGCTDTGANQIIGTGEVYDPVANTWTAITPYPDTASCNSFRGSSGQSCFGDDPSQLLPNSQILAGDIFTNTPQIWTPTPVTFTPGTWSAAAAKVYSDRSDEEAWAKLPNGNILVYDLFQAVSNGTKGFAEEYNSGTNSWADVTPGVNSNTGTLPLLTSSALGFEMGPLMRLQDGRMFQIGANQHTALYNPTTKVWAAGPDTIGPAITGTCASSCAYGADDAPAAELPTGHVIYAADAGVSKTAFSPPTCLFDFNPSTNTTSVMSPQPPDFAGSTCDTPAGTNNSFSSYITRMLMLPNGQLLFNDTGASGMVIYLYTPSSANAALPYRPVVKGVTSVGSKVFTLTGLQLNGQSAGSAYGDDVNTDENYPIVRLIASDGVTTYYCTSSNWSSVAVGSVGTETVTFTVPPAVTAGTYTLIVSGAGVQSIPQAIVITAGEL